MVPKPLRLGIAGVLLSILLLEIFIPNYQNVALAGNTTFVQPSWAGGVSSTAVAVDPTNRTGWNYFNTSTNLDFTNAPQLASSTFSFTDDTTVTTTGSATGGGFANGALSNTSYSSANTNISLAASQVAVNAFDAAIPPPPAQVPSVVGTYGSMVATGTYLYVLPGNSTAFYRRTLANTSTAWESFAALPSTPSVSKGMAVGANYVYVMQGNGTTNFYRHTLANTSTAWESFAALPGVGAATGGTVVDASSSYVYVLQGSGTGFYRHTLANTSTAWESFAALPGTVGAGTGTVVDANYVYVLQGGAKGFYRHTLANTSSAWESFAALPSNINGGSTVVDANYAYVSRGVFSGFYRHTLANTSTAWESFAALPGGVGAGGEMVVDASSSYVYVLGDGAGFYRHTLASTAGAWESSTVSPRIVGGRIAIDTANNFLYVLPGGNSTDFYRHTTADISSAWEGSIKVNFATLPRNAGYGGGTVSDANYVYVLVGGADFYRHTLANTSTAWDSFAALPGGVYDGGGTVIDANYVYVLRGNGGTNFYRHTLANTSTAWDSFATFPGIVGAGGRAVIDAGYVYVLPGASSAGFYRHTLANTSTAWDSYTALPGTVSTGGGTVVDASSSYVYVLRGNNTADFYRHTLANTSTAWDSFAALPGNVSNAGGMVIDANYVYVTQGNNATGFYRHTLANTSTAWESFAALPGGVYTGGGTVIDANYVYVMQGSGTGFYRHTLSDTSSAWVALNPTPSSVLSGSNIKMDVSNNAIYIIRGAGYEDFYRYTINQTTYAATGTFTSAAISLGAAALLNLSWTSSTPIAVGSNAVQLQIATSTDNVSYSSFVGPDGTSGTYFNTGTASLSGVLGTGAKYFKYKVTLQTSDTRFTPTFNNFTINYKSYYPTGTLISSIYNAGDAANRISNLQWAGATSSVNVLKFQLRASSTSEGVLTSVWTGPDGTADTYYTAANGNTIASYLGDGVGDQYYQYQAFFSSDGVGTPVLNSATVTYVVNSQPQIQNVTATQNGDRTVTIAYQILDPDTASSTGSVGFLTPSFKYCADGTNCQIITALPAGATSSQSINIDGVTWTAVTTTWTPTTDFNNILDTQAAVQVTVNDLQTVNNLAVATSTAFTLDTTPPNTAPTANSLTVTPVQNASGFAVISIGINDSDLNDIKLKTEYKSGACSYSGQVTSTILNGSNISATYSSSSIVHSNAAVGGYQLSTVSTLTGTNTVQYTWDTLTDVPAADGTYCLFVTPNDGTVDGTTVSTTIILDNVAPTAPGNLTINTTSTQSVTFAFGAASTETNFSEYKIFYKLGSSGVTSADTAFTSSTDSDLGSRTFNGTTVTTISNLTTSTQYVAKIFAYDSYSNSSTSAGEIAFYTLAAPAFAPIVSASTTAALTLVVSPGSNPIGSTVTYSICKTTNGTACDASSYIQADGSLGASAVWQTYTAWGGAAGLSITGLSANTGYQFLVRARNGDSIETAFSTANSVVYTLANPVTSVAVVNATVTSSLRATLSWANASQTGLKIERDNGCDGSYDVTVYDNATTNETSPTTTQTNFTANTCYQFRFASYNQQGVINTISYGVSNQLTMPPGQPQNLTPSSVASTSINWAWDSVAGATSYVLYNYLTNNTVTTTANTSFAHTDLTPNTSYQVAVRAVNSNGTGIASSPASTITDAQAPTWLTAVSGTKSVSSIRWTWTNGGQSAFFARDKNNIADNSGWITDAFWNQSILSANTQYTLQVRARNADLVETSNSEIAAYTLQNPPTSVTFSAVSPTSLTVTAEGSFPNIGSDSSVINFNNGVGTAIDISDGPSWTNTGLSPNTQYTYTVYATNGNNDQTVSVQGSKYTAANVPSNFTGTTDPRSASLSWSHNSNNVATEYYLTAEGATSQNSGWVTGTAHTFSNLTAGAWYTFTIKARNVENLESVAASVVLRVRLLSAYSPPLELAPVPVTIVSSTTTTTKDATSGGGSGNGNTGSAPTSTPPHKVVIVPSYLEIPSAAPSQVALFAAQLGKGGTRLTKYTSFFTTYLYPSRSSKDIVRLQEFLKDLGFFTYGKTTGFFGSATVEALNMFQKAGAVRVAPYADGQTIQLVNSILSAPTILNIPSPETVHPLVNTLCRGAKGPEVIELQTFLKKSGFFTAAYLANFGQATDKALRSFQKANKLKVTGCTDQTTRAKVFSLLAGTTTVSVVPEVKDIKVVSGRFGGAIFATIRTNKGNNICYGAVSPAVTNLQTLLHERGYLKEKPTGHFGDKTRSAVKKLQQERKVTPVNGCVGPKTLEIMELL